MKTKTPYASAIGVCLIALYLFLTFHCFSQGVSINTTGAAADNSAMLDVSATNQGMLIPRMTTTNRDLISSPAEGLLIYNTTTKCFEAFVNGAWNMGFCPCNPPLVPTANAASNRTASSFTANWSASAGASSYYFDVSTVSNFASFMGTYNSLNVGTALTYNITGLTAGATYYYRVKAVSSCGIGANSNTITTTTVSLTNNLVAFWKLDESGSVSAVDATGNANDMGNYNSAQFSGTSPLINNHIVLNGTNQYLKGVSSTSLNTISSGFSVSFWVNFASGGTSQISGFIDRWAEQDPDRFLWRLEYWNNGAIDGIFSDDGTYNTNHYSSFQTQSNYITAADEGIWTHLVLTYDVGLNTFKIYKNNVCTTPANTGYNITSIYTNNYNIHIGALWSTNTFIRYLKGSLDEMGLWSRALTTNEVSDLYNSGAGLQYPF
ncbi:MAG: hypothetical protein HGB12_00055 [Bacteroidetes bacterium]|nr:hypothetical protein [Bacteroidota bacterium]